MKLVQAEAIVFSTGSKEDKKDQHPRVARQTKTKTAPTKTGQSWFCILCGEDRVEDMVRCVNCYT